jgi:hypothetical protein
MNVYGSVFAYVYVSLLMHAYVYISCLQRNRFDPTWQTFSREWRCDPPCLMCDSSHPAKDSFWLSKNVPSRFEFELSFNWLTKVSVVYCGGRQTSHQGKCKGTREKNKALRTQDGIAEWPHFTQASSSYLVPWDSLGPPSKPFPLRSEPSWIHVFGGLLLFRPGLATHCCC